MTLKNLLFRRAGTESELIARARRKNLVVDLDLETNEDWPIIKSQDETQTVGYSFTPVMMSHRPLHGLRCFPKKVVDRVRLPGVELKVSTGILWSPQTSLAEYGGVGPEIAALEAIYSMLIVKARQYAAQGLNVTVNRQSIDLFSITAAERLAWKKEDEMHRGRRYEKDKSVPSYIPA